MRTCCFCIDLPLAARAVALTETTLAVPCIVSGVASLNVADLAAGLLLFVSAWLLFDGVFMERRSFVNGWLLITTLKVIVCLMAGAVCVLVAFDSDYVKALIDDEEEATAQNATEIKSKFIDEKGARKMQEEIWRLYKDQLTGLLGAKDGTKLFFFVYAIFFFAAAFAYLYFFAAVFSFSRTLSGHQEPQTPIVEKKKKAKSPLPKYFDDFERPHKKKKSKKSNLDEVYI